MDQLRALARVERETWVGVRPGAGLEGFQFVGNLDFDHSDCGATAPAGDLKPVAPFDQLAVGGQDNGGKLSHAVEDSDPILVEDPSSCGGHVESNLGDVALGHVPDSAELSRPGNRLEPAFVSRQRNPNLPSKFTPTVPGLSARHIGTA